jgi:hypothetical protein
MGIRRSDVSLVRLSDVSQVKILPFKSKAQQGYLHAHPEVLGKKALHEWDEASKGSHDLPEHVHKSTPYSMAHAARKKESNG